LLGLSIAYTIISTIFLIASTRLLKSLFAVFLTLDHLFLLLDATLLGVGAAGKILWYESLICAATAWYLLAAIIINDAFGSEVLPLGVYVKPVAIPLKAAAARA
jgi:hypothetical protein